MVVGWRGEVVMKYICSYRFINNCLLVRKNLEFLRDMVFNK